MAAYSRLRQILLLACALGSILLGLPYLLRAFGPTEAEVGTWGQIAVLAGALLLILSVALGRSRARVARALLAAGYLGLALLQVLPVILWFSFHGMGISDGTPPSAFVAHWAYSVPHVALMVAGLLAAVLVVWPVGRGAD